MLKELFLENFVITKTLHIEFSEKFNVISGETGAGKTLLLQALALLSGQRADFSLIREDAKKASLKAVFKLSEASLIYEILNSLSFDISSEEDLVIQRDLTKDGKTKILINHQVASLSILKKMSPYLFEMVSQNMQVQLKSSSYHREFLDKVAKTSDLLTSYQKLYDQESDLMTDLQNLEGKLSDREFLVNVVQKEVDELSSAELSQESEDQLFESFHKLSKSQETCEKLHQILSGLSKSHLPSELKHHAKALEPLLGCDETLSELHQEIVELSTRLSSLTAFLESYLYETNFSDEEYQSIESKLTKLKSLKRAHGPTYEDCRNYLEAQIKELELLTHLDEKIQDTKNLLSQYQNEKKHLSEQISKLRHNHAQDLSKEVTKKLKELDMASAEFKIQCESSSFSRYGADTIRFLIKNNLSSHFSSIESSASGGELARILLALLLSSQEKQNDIALIFDEIDANIGGETATKIGQKLSDLGHKTQVICITHFAQVASSAHRHIKLVKLVNQNQLSTSAKILEKEEIQKELLRMVGGDLSLLAMNENHPDKSS